MLVRGGRTLQVARCFSPRYPDPGNDAALDTSTGNGGGIAGSGGGSITADGGGTQLRVECANHQQPPAVSATPPSVNHHG